MNPIGRAFNGGLAIATVLLTLAACSNQEQRNRAHLLDDGRKLLEQTVEDPANAVPDSVLNQTICVLVFPAARRASQNGVEGLVSCREKADGPFGAPAIAIRAVTQQAQPPDTLLFILSTTAAAALRNGKSILPKTAPGPSASTTPVLAPVEVQADAVGYVVKNWHLLGAALNGAVRTVNRAEFPTKQSQAYTAALTSFFTAVTPTGIILHHTSTIPTTGEVPSNKKQVDEYHQARGFDVICFGKEYHVAYHYLVLPDGRVQQGRPERCAGAHALGYNSYLGISIAGDFSSEDAAANKKASVRPSPQQINAVIELCRKLRAKYKIPLQHVLRHSDVSPTRCPGDQFPFNEVLAQLAVIGK